MYDIIIVGGGASGLMACVSAIQENANAKICLIERNEKLGKKIYITGKGHCNITNLCGVNELIENVVRNPKFLYSSFNTFSSYDVYDFFESNGCKLKIERGNRVFPESEKASDITQVFAKIIKRNNVDIRLNTIVVDIQKDDAFKINIGKEILLSKKLILATGGASYPLTGSLGDGYKFASNLGHTITELRPSLCGFVPLIKGEYDELNGLNLRNIKIRAIVNGKQFNSDIGEVKFYPNVLAGPLILTLSSQINRLNFENVTILIDLKPSVDYTILMERISNNIKELKTNKLEKLIENLVPKQMVNYVKKSLQFDYVSVNQLKENDIEKFAKLLKNLPFKFKSLEKIDRAIITSGGIVTNEIEPKTMESKIISNLFVTGELIDCDALTGGFNMQIALSTGYVAGKYASKGE